MSTFTGAFSYISGRAHKTRAGTGKGEKVGRLQGGGKVKMWMGDCDEGTRVQTVCMRAALNPQKHHDGSCSVQMGKKGY